MNTTLCATKDRWNYLTYNHRKSRAVTQNWIDEGDFIDAHRAFYPEDKKLYTYRKKENDEIIIQSRLNYSLASRELFNLIKRVKMVNISQAISDHNGIKTTVKIEKFEDRPRTFRANP